MILLVQKISITKHDISWKCYRALETLRQSVVPVDCIWNTHNQRQAFLILLFICSFFHHHHWINGIKIELPNIAVLLPLANFSTSPSKEDAASLKRKRTGNWRNSSLWWQTGHLLPSQLPHTFTPSSSSAVLVIHNTVWNIYLVNSMLYDGAHLSYYLMSCQQMFHSTKH